MEVQTVAGFICADACRVTVKDTGPLNQTITLEWSRSGRIENRAPLTPTHARHLARLLYAAARRTEKAAEAEPPKEF